MCAGSTTPAAFAIRPKAANVNSVYGLAPEADRDRRSGPSSDRIDLKTRSANVTRVGPLVQLVIFLTAAN